MREGPVGCGSPPSRDMKGKKRAARVRGSTEGLEYFIFLLAVKSKSNNPPPVGCLQRAAECVRVRGRSAPCTAAGRGEEGRKFALAINQ